MFKISKYLIQNRLLFCPYSPLRKIINSESKGLEMYWYFKVPQISVAHDPLAFELTSPRVSAETPTVGMQRNGWLAENF